MQTPAGGGVGAGVVDGGVDGLVAMATFVVRVERAGLGSGPTLEVRRVRSRRAGTAMSSTVSGVAKAIPSALARERDPRTARRQDDDADNDNDNQRRAAAIAAATAAAAAASSTPSIIASVEGPGGGRWVARATEGRDRRRDGCRSRWRLGHRRLHGGRRRWSGWCCRDDPSRSRGRRYSSRRQRGRRQRGRRRGGRGGRDPQRIRCRVLPCACGLLEADNACRRGIRQHNIRSQAQISIRQAWALNRACHQARVGVA